MWASSTICITVMSILIVFQLSCRRLLPYLYAINLNGMSRQAKTEAEQILPLGQGELDLELLK